MAETFVWAGMVFLVCAILIWRLDRLAERYLSKHVNSTSLPIAEAEVALAEHRVAAELNERTIDEQVELRQAGLKRKTAEELAAAEIASDEELREARIAAEHSVIGAQAEAKQRLAEEFVRSEHKAASTGDDPVSQYDRYLKATLGRGADYMSFDDFLDTLSQH